MVAKEIFRAYDIRGIVNETLTEDTVEKIGLTLGTKVLATGGNAIVVGRDGRLSGPDLIAKLKQGILATGCNVVDVGMVPTPLLYFASFNLNINSAVMLTGSHNPANYNGLKIILNGKAIHGDEILAIYDFIQAGNFSTGQGLASSKEIIDEYIATVTKDIKLNKKIKLAVDCGNGIAGIMAAKLYQAIGCEVTELYCDVDGNFPNHHPDPGDPKNLVELQECVKSGNYDVGFGFDGDGDRLGVIDNQGKIIWPDRLLMLLAEDVLSRNPDGTIIYDIKSTRDLKDVVLKAGGTPVMYKTGHSLIKAKMKETNALLAGEMSGHIFFKERWYGFDDALYAGCRLLEILAKDTRDVATILASYPENVSTPEISIAVTEESKFNIMAEFAADKNFVGATDISNIDGVRVEYTDGWGLVRASNTTPKLVARFEAANEVALNRIKAQFQAKLKAIEPSLDF